MRLTEKRCVPCEGGMPPLSHDQIQPYLPEVPGWVITESDKKIKRELRFKDFREAMAFVNRVAELAETEGHHPDIAISYAEVTLRLWTHIAGGLTENDFILAAKIDQVLGDNPAAAL